MSEAPSSGPGRILVIAVVLLALGLGAYLLRGGDESTADAGEEVPAAAGGIAEVPASDRVGAGPGVVIPSSGEADEVEEAEEADAPDAPGLVQMLPPPVLELPMGVSPEGESLDLPEISWDLLPESGRADAFEASLETLSDWAAEIEPEYDAQLLGTDCSAPPCLVGMSFDGTSFEEDHVAKAAFQREFSDELTRLRGTAPAMTIVTSTPNGTTAVWQYELPQGMEDQEGVHADLNESASLRHQQWVKGWSASRSSSPTP